MFPANWYPKETPGYMREWLISVALKRGTWVRVDTRGRPMEVMVRGKNQSFIDVSRSARARRNLRLLETYLDKLAEEVSDDDLLKSRQSSLSRLDQGLGDLVRIVRGSSATARRGGARRGRSGSQAAAARSSTDKE